MATIWAWPASNEVAILIGFHVFLGVVLAVDLGVFNRKAHSVSMREAAVWTVIWISLAFVFAFGVWKLWHWMRPAEAGQGADKALMFISGYLVEQSLSVDNLFVFLVIFRYFGVPDHLRHRVLFWGIVGAVLMRATFILAGAALLHYFHWMIYVFGLFLIYTAYKLIRSVEAEIDPGRNPVLRLARRFLPVLDSYDVPHFWVRRQGKWYATPLPLVLLVVESTDVVFAIDSIPAIFGITTDPFIVYTSNIFAILGLRSMYFLLANFLGMFRYLSIGLGAVLAFVGLKMLTQDWLQPHLDAVGVTDRHTILISLGMIAAILLVSVVASIVAGPKEPLEHPPEFVAETPEGLSEEAVADTPPSDNPQAPPSNA